MTRNLVMVTMLHLMWLKVKTTALHTILSKIK
jgi:hypothetical protein